MLEEPPLIVRTEEVIILNNPRYDDFRRAVSRILSSPKIRRRESFVLAASTRDPNHFWPWSGQLRGPLFGLAPDGVFRASALTLGAVGFYSTFSPLPRSFQGCQTGCSLRGQQNSSQFGSLGKSGVRVKR